MHECLSRFIYLYETIFGVMVTRATKNEENMRERQLLPLTKRIKIINFKVINFGVNYNMN